MQKNLTELTLVLIESSDERTINDEVRIERVTMASLCLTIVQLVMLQDDSVLRVEYCVQLID